jgi:hypothetical protein
VTAGLPLGLYLTTGMGFVIAYASCGLRPDTAGGPRWSAPEEMRMADPARSGLPPTTCPSASSTRSR